MLKYFRPLALLGSMMLAAGCSFPTNDIVSTTTEDVGPYDMTSAVTGDALSGRVCVANPKNTDEVVKKIVQQLKSQSYGTVTLDLYSVNGPIARYIWTGNGERHVGLSDEENPC